MTPRRPRAGEVWEASNGSPYLLVYDEGAHALRALPIPAEGDLEAETIVVSWQSVLHHQLVRKGEGTFMAPTLWAYIRRLPGKAPEQNAG